jgi:Phage capsid protein
MPGIQDWYKEVIKDKVTSKFQALGGYLDNTMTVGDVQANTVKFPVSGRMEVYKLTGAIEAVPTNTADLTTVSMLFEDFEASAYWRVQDAYKAGPSEHNALADMMVKAVRRKKDNLKLDALAAFKAAQPAAVTTIGTGAEVPDIKTFLEGAVQIRATGAEGMVWCVIPEMYALQLDFYKEFANSQWRGPSDLPFSQGQISRARTVRGVNFMALPDEYFKSPAAQPTQLITWMWHMDAMGAEMPWNAENVSMDKDITKQGDPYLCKNGLGGAAIGILPNGVKQFLLQKITTVTRPA